MVCPSSSTKPLPEPVINQYHIDYKEQIEENFEFKNIQNMQLSVQENAFENISWTMAAIFFRRQCLKNPLRFLIGPLQSPLATGDDFLNNIYTTKLKRNTDLLQQPNSSVTGWLLWCIHDDVIKWKQIPRYWSFVRGIHLSPVFPLTKARCLIFSLIYAWTNGWANNRDAGDLKRHRAHYDVTVMFLTCNCDHFAKARWCI